MSIKANLIAAKALIATPETWCQGEFAEDSRGLRVATTSPKACCRCALGALGAAVGVDPWLTSTPLPRNIVNLLDAGAAQVVTENAKDGIDCDAHFDIVDLNDDTWSLKISAHEAVMKAFDYAIEHAPN